MEEWEIKHNAGETVNFSELTKKTFSDEIKEGTKETIKFWDLPEIKSYKRIEGETDNEFLDRINDPTKWLYGSELRDAMLLRNDSTFPLYGHLARKALIHYAGEHYNAHTISIESEFNVRWVIKTLVEYKVQGKAKDYDWELVDNYLTSVIYDELGLDLPLDFKRLDREVLTEFRSLYHNINLGPVN